MAKGKKNTKAKKVSPEVEEPIVPKAPRKPRINAPIAPIAPPEPSGIVVKFALATGENKHAGLVIKGNTAYFMGKGTRDKFRAGEIVAERAPGCDFKGYCEKRGLELVKEYEEI